MALATVWSGLDNSNDDAGSDTGSATDDATFVDNTALWLCHKPSDDPDHCDDPDGAVSNLMHIAHARIAYAGRTGRCD